MTRPDEAVALLRALWDVLDGDGFVELRPLHPNRPSAGSPESRRQHAARRWLPLEEACAVMPAVLGWCGNWGLSSYFGVLPRLAHGAGGADDVGLGAAAWVDIDLPPAECRERLTRVPFRPSVVVLTGRGVHAYWLLSEPEAPQVCADLTARLTRALDADRSAVDPSRLLRLPGSLNPKHHGHPIARLARLDADTRYHAADLDDWLPALPRKSPVRAAPAAPVLPRPEQIGLALRGRPRAARAMLDRRIANIRATLPTAADGTREVDPATGKPEVGRHGRLYAAGRFAARVAASGALDLGEARRVLVAVGAEVGLDAEDATRHVDRGIAREVDLGGGRARPFEWQGADRRPAVVRVGGGPSAR
jgi:hypothetical protein